jgi:arylsulfatase A-like enzyme
VAALIEQLAVDGELANTYVAFITDNGFLLGEHRWVGKTLGYEPALKTPLLARGPGIRAGSVTHRTATLVDLVPTWLEIAGATADVEVDGVSLLGVLQGEAPTRLHPGGVLIQAGPHRRETGVRGWYFRGVRTKRFTYLRFRDGWIELYDRVHDPEQLTSLAYTPEYSRVAAELGRRTSALAGCRGADECNRTFRALPSPEPLLLPTQPRMHERHHGRTLSRGGGDALHGAGADVADGEDAGD